MNLQITPVTAEDREFFIHAYHAAKCEMIKEMFGWDEATQERFANQTIEAFDDDGMNIIWHDGKRVGGVCWCDYPDHLWLDEVFLSPEYQGQGIGGQIVELSKDKARQAGKELRLETLLANLSAKKLYERFGFKVTEATNTHWKMTWTLDSEK